MTLIENAAGFRKLLVELVVQAGAERASRLRWPRRIMVSIASLRNRLAAAPSPSSPVRSRYSQAIWKDSSSSWESEMLMGRTRIPAACVPRHLRFATRFRPSTASGSERKITSPKTWVSPVSEDTDRVMRITPISPKSAVRKGDLSGLVLRVSGDDGDLAAGPAVAAGAR